MAVTADRSQALSEIEAAWEPFRVCIQAAPETELVELTDAGGWSVRDHIDHITAWEAFVTFALTGRAPHEALRVRKEDAVPPFDPLNALIRAGNADASLGEVLAASEAGHRAFIAAVEALPEDGLERSLASYVPDTTWPGAHHPIRGLVYGVSVHHYPEHHEWIEEILKQQSGSQGRGIDRSRGDL